MKTAQYIRQEKAISAADAGGVRERWLWGLRLLRDPEAFSPGSTQLKPGRADELVQAAKAAGLKLTVREIQFRLQCARTYPTEAQIANAGSQFEGWTELRTAGFPAIDAPDGEPLADHRTPAERDHDHARALMDKIGEQGTLFPLSDFEPVVTTLKELAAYAEQMRELTDRFAERDRKRREYLDRLIEAADGDLSMTWQDAHNRLDPDDADAAQVGAA